MPVSVSGKNTYDLQQLVAYFKKDQLTERQERGFPQGHYSCRVSKSCCQQSGACQTKPDERYYIKISKKLAKDRTLKDMEELALRAFGEYQLEFVRIHVKLGSVIILVFFPETLTGKLEHLAHKNAAVFEDAGVEEVSVGGRVVFLKFWKRR